MDAWIEGLKSRRELAGLSQFQLARLSGVSRNRISMAECGYLSLTDVETSSIVKAIAEAAETRVLNVRKALAQISQYDSRAVAV